MPGFPTNSVGTPTTRGKARRYKSKSIGLKTGHYMDVAAWGAAVLRPYKVVAPFPPLTRSGHRLKACATKS